MVERDSNIDTDFLSAICKYGYKPPLEILEDNKIHRFSTRLDSTKKDGWYVTNGESGAFGSWRDREEDQVWHKNKTRHNNGKKDMTPTQIFESAGAALVTNLYLKKKGIKPLGGIREIFNMSSSVFGFSGKPFLISGLLIPIFDCTDSLVNLQVILQDGSKMFMKNCPVASCFFPIGKYKEAEKIYITEGYATGVSIAEVLSSEKNVVVVAFSAYQLSNVEKEIKKINPTAKIFICADSDKVGAIEAAKCESKSIIPDGRKDGEDWNDYMIKNGKEKLKEMIDAGSKVSNIQILQNWADDLIMRKTKDSLYIPVNRVYNIEKILLNTDIGMNLYFNEFSSQIIIDNKEIDDVMQARIKTRLEKEWIGDKVTSSDLKDAIILAANARKRHPIKEYLERLVWDRVKRVELLFPVFLGCEDTPYSKGVSISLFVSAIERIYNPGCKVDTMIVLESEQGFGKTKFWRILFGEYCHEVISSLYDKDFFLFLRGVWCADFGELDAFNRAETTRIKQILTSQFDKFRVPYGSHDVIEPRTNIFVGGTNRNDWQQDATGGRRFYPVQITEHKLDVKELSEIRDQLWAEAVELSKLNLEWWNVPNAEEHQECSYTGDVWEDVIGNWAYGRKEISLSELLVDAVGVELNKQTKSEQVRAANILKNLGYVSYRTIRNGKRKRIYNLKEKT